MSSIANVYIIIMFRNCQYQSFHYVQVLPISKIQKTWWMDDPHYQCVMASSLKPCLSIMYSEHSCSLPVWVSWFSIHCLLDGCVFSIHLKLITLGKPSYKCHDKTPFLWGKPYIAILFLKHSLDLKG